jgi:hypothetical protein
MREKVQDKTKSEKGTKKTSNNAPPLLLDSLIRLDEIPELLRALGSDDARIDIRPASQVVENTRGDGGCY